MTSEQSRTGRPPAAQATLPAKGHTKLATTEKYAGEYAAGDRERLNRIAMALGLEKEHLKLEEGGA